MSTFLHDTLEARRVGVLESKILRTLLYFDIFHHPLRAGEIRQYLHGRAGDEEAFRDSLERLTGEGLVQERGGFYALGKVDTLARRRIDGETLANSALVRARKYSALIASFPFVRGVCISGSLSKGYMDAHTDIDYFIITQPGRLWLSRTLLILYKKIFLLNSRKNFCVNYFISSDNLSIPDQNIFTATEAASLIPMYNASLYGELLRNNSWVRGYFPQFAHREPDCVNDHRPRLKSRLEKMFSGSVGEKLDVACFRLTLGYWKRKFRHFDAATFDHRIRSRKNVSKHHPHSFQEKVLKSFEARIHQFESRHALSLH